MLRRDGRNIPFPKWNGAGLTGAQDAYASAVWGRESPAFGAKENK